MTQFHVCYREPPPRPDWIGRQSLRQRAAAAFVPVEVVEVGDDDGDRQRDGEDAGDDAQRADQLAPDADRRDVAVADRRHRHDRPPERARDRRDLRALLAGLGVVRHRAEDDHRDEQEEEEHAELVQARLDRHAEDPQTLRRRDQRQTGVNAGRRSNMMSLLQIYHRVCQ